MPYEEPLEEESRKRWPLIAFGAACGAELAHQGVALVGVATGGSFVAYFQLFAVLALMNSVLIGIYCWRRYGPSKPGKRDWWPVDGAQWLRFGWLTVVSVVTEFGFTWPAQTLRAKEIPIAVLTFLAQCPILILAVREAILSGRRRLVMAAALQLVGVWLMLGAVNLRALIMPVMIWAGIAVFGTVVFTLLAKRIARIENEAQPGQEQFVADKITLLGSVIAMAAYTMLMDLAFLFEGLPTLSADASLGDFLLGAGLALVAAAFARIRTVALIRGHAVAVTSAATAALGVSLLWVWGFQGLAPTLLQGIGAVITAWAAWDMWRLQSRPASESFRPDSQG